jgi:molybdopterin/thiamine biosynthesis adenylyltransferase
MRIVIIGLGGIGTIFVNRLCRFINYSKAEILKDVHIHLIDGDDYEEKNYERQEFLGLGNKAKIKERELAKTYSKIRFSTFANYLNQENISENVLSGDVVCLCVDNHPTRKLVSKHCSTLQNIILISGGNDWTDGNVQIYARKDGVDLTPSLEAYHPEIQNPTDKSPEDMSCEELSKVEPQLYFANLSAATLMCWVFWNVVIEGNIEECEVYFDIELMAARSVVRAVK